MLIELNKIKVKVSLPPPNEKKWTLRPQKDFKQPIEFEKCLKLKGHLDDV